MSERSERISQRTRHRYVVAGLALAVTAAAALAAGTMTANAATTSVQGIDVSNLQGTIDWEAVRADGQSFAFLKASEGNGWNDARYAANDAAASAAGLYRGAYHFARPDTSVNDAINEARHLYAVTGAVDGPGELPPVLDLEDSGGLSVSALTGWVTAFLTELKALTGRTPIIYTSPAFWQSSMGNSNACTGYPLWVAHYTSGSPTVPGGWAGYTFWQHTSTASVDGVNTVVDHDWFAGTTAGLAALAAGKAINPYSPVGVCGTGYSVIDSATLGTAGTVYLLYNDAAGTNCVVTIKQASVGTTSAVAAFLEVQGATRVTDSGSFAYYAGPVRAKASDTCVKWGGSVGGTGYTSPFEHCG